MLKKESSCNKFKAVVFDIDDTIYHHGLKEVIFSTIEAIKRLKEKGYIIIIATGRDMREEGNNEMLKIVKPDAVISLNGQLVQIKNEIIYEFKFDRELKTKIFNYAIENNISFGAMKNNIHYTNWRSDYANRYINELENLFDYKIEDRPLLDAIDDDIAAISYYDDQNTVEKLLATNKQVKAIHYDGYGGNLMSSNISKATGVEKLFSYFNFNFEQVIFFGDGDNDIELLERAGFGCAVGKSTINAQKAANIVIDLIENDSIYKTLVEYGLID